MAKLAKKPIKAVKKAAPKVNEAVNVPKVEKIIKKAEAKVEPIEKVVEVEMTGAEKFMEQVEKRIETNISLWLPAMITKAEVQCIVNSVLK